MGMHACALNVHYCLSHLLYIQYIRLPRCRTQVSLHYSSLSEQKIQYGPTEGKWTVTNGEKKFDVNNLVAGIWYNYENYRHNTYRSYSQ